MILENKILESLSGLLPPFIPSAVDMRDKLPTNPELHWSKRDVSKLRGLVLHQALGPGDIEDINRYHIGSHSHLNPGIGVHSISYTFGIRKNGEICILNDLSVKTWSQGSTKFSGDENASYIACLVVGDFSYPNVKRPEEPTLEQITSSLILWKALQTLFNWNNTSLHGHFDFGKASCPGSTLELIIRSVRKNTRVIANYNAFKQQQALNMLGANLKVDGIFGNKSKSALIQIQKKLGLTPDGIFGPMTDNAIMTAIGQIP